MAAAKRIPLSHLCPGPGLWDLHGYETSHGGLEPVKDEAGGECHEVVHEGSQGEDE